ncbi:signal peptidase I [Jannaschia sp. R86511]|uniref:signal peptidase I n=1 Tax=Jannaschia sp. R86511 TaxID=3093853 RepID=UPI0036D33D9F
MHETQRATSTPSAGTRSAPRTVARWLLLLAAATAWFALLGPSTLGGPMTLVQVTGQSMEPGMHTGDLAVVRTAGTYDVGDVVAFRIPMADGSRGPVVIHRVQARADGTMTLRGDNNDWDDPWPVTDEMVVGRLWLHLPAVGTWVGRVATPINLAALVAAAVAFLVMAGGRNDEQVDRTEQHSLAASVPDRSERPTVVDLREPTVAPVRPPATVPDGASLVGADRELTLQEWVVTVGERP